jgi:hypothetical protein
VRGRSMFIVPALAALFCFVCLRPHEVFEPLRLITFNVMVGLLALAYALDARLGVARPKLTALTTISAAYFGLATLSLVVKAPDRISTVLPALVAPFIGFLAISQGIATLRGLEATAKVLLVITLFLSVICVHQGLQAKVCFVPTTSTAPSAVDEPDGRPCEERSDCKEGGLLGVEYLCEHPGLFGTHSIVGRVRYRGMLKDPNEISWAVGLGLPLAFALYERKRSGKRLALMILTVALGAICTMMTKSRSGQLTFASVLAVYMVRRYRWKGIAAAALVSLPVLLLGGRSGEEAEQSTEERLEAWSEGLNMLRAYPLMGVGDGQFTEHHYLTAHSALVLTMAELGPAGLVLWMAAIFQALRTPLAAYRTLAGRPEAAGARAWAIGLFAALVATLVSAAFLSIPHHPLLWLVMGLVGALDAAVRAHEPTFNVRFTLRHLVGICGAAMLFVVALYLYLRAKGM